MPCSVRYSPAGAVALIAPAGEMWSVVTESPSLARTFAPWMSVTGAGSAGIPSKYGGGPAQVGAGAPFNVLPPGARRAPDVGRVRVPFERVARWHAEAAPVVVAGEDVGVVTGEHLGGHRVLDDGRHLVRRRPDVGQVDRLAVGAGAQRLPGPGRWPSARPGRR